MVLIYHTTTTSFYIIPFYSQVEITEIRLTNRVKDHMSFPITLQNLVFNVNISFCEIARSLHTPEVSWL